MIMAAKMARRHTKLSKTLDCVRIDPGWRNYRRPTEPGAREPAKLTCPNQPVQNTACSVQSRFL